MEAWPANTMSSDFQLDPAPLLLFFSLMRKEDQETMKMLALDVIKCKENTE